MIFSRLLCVLGCLAASRSMASDIAVDGMVDRIAAHFEAASSRLRPEDASSLEQFVSRARSTPGARLTLLVPITTEPAQSRFLAARVSELERHIQALAETAEYRRISLNSNADVLWLALVLPVPVAEESSSPMAGAVAKAVDQAPSQLPALTAPARPSPPSVGPAEIRLTDWVVRGVKRPVEGPVSAYVARTDPGAVPREVFERQPDRDLGLVREISLSAEEGWVVRTEIGWIGQGSPSRNP